MIPGLNPYGIGEASRITMQREGASLKNATRPGRPAERFLKWVWDKKGGTADLVLFPLTLFAWLYGLVCRLRPFLYEKGFLPRKRADAFIVSVGNLTVGGTGKTPFTIYLAETWREKGYSVGIVSRGYGRNDKRSVVLVSDGEKMLEAASAAGDEPYLMAERLKGIPVVVSADRFKGCQWLIRHFKMDLILLDDAFQHVPIHRDMNLLLIDAMNPYGNHRLLPRGPLREPLSAARRADLVIFTRSEVGWDLSETIREIERSGCRTLRCTFRPTELIHLNTGVHRPVSDLKGRPILCFCGIGNPEAFVKLLNRLGAQIKEEIFFGDHHPYQAADLLRIKERGAGVGVKIAITTEKDAVKIKPFLPVDMEIWALRVDIAFLEDSKEWESLLFDLEIVGKDQLPPKGSAN